MLTRILLKIIKEYGFPCHILTKSDLVIRDLDVISSMDQCYVTISLSSLNPNVYNVFEKNVQHPKIRLDIVKKLVENGAQSGIAIIPAIPYLLDDELEEFIILARKQKAQYIILKHLELKGDQKYCFMEILQKNFPDIVEKFQKLYESSYMPDESYISKLKNTFEKLCRKHNIKIKI
jgi:DNA repair photolyase